MTYEEFKQSIFKKVKEALPADTNVKLDSLLKENNRTLDALVIDCNGSNVGVCVYLNMYYDKYDMFGDLDNVCNDILQTYKNNRIQENIDVSFFANYESAKEFVFCKVVNYNRSSELLKTVPHMKFLDLAIVFSCYLKTPSGNASIRITNEHLKAWNTTEDELYKQAMKNTPKILPYVCHNIIDALKTTAHTDADFNKVDSFSDGIELSAVYVLYNESKVYGATYILYPEILAQVAEKLQSDLYILPSSIHEIILLPATESYETSELQKMVSSINSSMVSNENFLSNNVYYYSRKSRKVEIIEPLQPAQQTYLVKWHY